MTQELTGTGAEHREGAAGGAPRMSLRMLASLALVAVGTVAFVVAMSGALVSSDVLLPPGFNGSISYGTPDSAWRAATSSPALGITALACAVAPILWLVGTLRRSVWARFVGAAISVSAFASLAVIFASETFQADLAPGSQAINVRFAGEIRNPDVVFVNALAQAFSLTTPWSLSWTAWLWLVGTACLALAFVVMPAPQRRPIDD